MNTPPTTPLSVPYIAWEIQKSCNLGCQFCYSSSWNQQRLGGINQKNPPVDYIKEKLNLLKKRFDIKYINWTGGEVLLRYRDILPILKHSAQLGIKNIVSSNAYFTKIGLTKHKYFELLESWDPYLYAMGISLDSSDREMNSIMRAEYDPKHPFTSEKGSTQYDDVLELIQEYSKRRFQFSLKINTIVSNVNKEKLNCFVPILQNTPCILHLVEFNDRECPPETAEKFSLPPLAFYKIVHSVQKDIEASYKPCQFFVTSREANRGREVYCFFVLNSKNEILVPKGPDHIVVGTLEDTSQVEKNVTETLSDQPPETALKTFSEKNKDILARYMNRSIAMLHYGKSFEILRQLISDSIRCPKLTNLKEQFASPNLLTPESLEQIQKRTGGKNFYQTRTQTLLESPKVGRFLFENYGILGGTILFFDKATNQRLSTRQMPTSLSMPFCFNTQEKKRRYLAALTNPQDLTSFGNQTPLIEKFLGPEELSPQEFISASILISQHIEAQLATLVKHQGGATKDPWMQTEKTSHLATAENAAKAIVNLPCHTKYPKQWQELAQCSTETDPTIFPEIWEYLFSPLFDLHIDIPNVYHYKLLSTETCDVFAALYLVEDIRQMMGKQKDFAEDITQRCGGFLQTLALPALSPTIKA